MNFADHLALVREFIDRRQEIVDRVDSRVLNARGKSRGARAQILDSCFFALPGLPPGLARLNGQLAASHVADGFEPIVLEGFSHALDPLELVARAHRYWERHRWPGRNIRRPFAGALVSVFILRQIEHLSLRIWDGGADAADTRLLEIQALLDRLNADSIADALVRDARWLIQTAQGPLTRRLEPYFRMAGRISASFTAPRRLEIHKAGAVLTSGHLRSQLRHRASEINRPVDDPEVLATTRNSNSMDAALLVSDLVPLLEAYDRACEGDNLEERLNLADAILQGVAADPELFLTRLDLIAPCTMIEDLFIQGVTDGHFGYTPLGQAHRHALERYAALIARHAGSLREDASRLDPRRGVYSPLGLVYGFCADVLSNMTLDTLFGQPSFGLDLADMFASRDALEHKRARADGWQSAREGEDVRNPVGYSADWAAQAFERSMAALDARARHRERVNASAVADARLFVMSERSTGEPPAGGSLPDGIVVAQEHCVTSDLPRALSTGATAFPRGQIVSDRNEGRFLASGESGGHWFGISKVVLTLCTSQGKDALVTGVPPLVVDTLRLTCPGLVVIASTS